MKRVVACDTGPLLHLREAGSLDVLRETGQVLIPPRVEAETAALDGGWLRERPLWVEVVPLQESYEVKASNWIKAGLLHAGEAEALALARQVDAAWFLTDDTAARVLALQEGLEVHGSLGVILWAAAMGHFDQQTAAAALDALGRSSLWLSPRVLAEAREALLAIFS